MKKPVRWPLYPRFVFSLLTGRQLKLRESRPVGALDKWKDHDLNILIGIAASQLEAQRASLDRLLSRAQLLFTTLLALLALLFGAGAEIWASTTPLWDTAIPRGLLTLSVILLAVSLLGTAALIAIRKEFDTISAPVLSRWDHFDLEQLAVDYAESVGVGEETNNAHLTVFGTSVRLTVYGALALGTAWAVGAIF